MMQFNVTQKPAILLVGLAVRTSNQAEQDHSQAKIARTLQRYATDEIADKIQHRSDPGVTYCVYTDYTDGVDGDYTYFVGEAVQNSDAIDNTLTTITIPKQSYAQFTVGPGPMPQVCIDAWRSIWAMSSEDLQGERSFLADFEIYDHRAQKQQRTVLDIYVGIGSPE